MLIKALTLLQEMRNAAPCVRHLDMVFDNQDLHEVGVFMLDNGAMPKVAECNSGEFRQDIKQYLNLRKGLGINRSR